jgi:hypothetical protein
MAAMDISANGDNYIFYILTLFQDNGASATAQEAGPTL